MTKLIDFGTTEELDKYLIPENIYNETLNKQKLKIQNYFILHPLLLKSFVGFNGMLKLSNQLASNKKCNCYYEMPWKTHYDEEFGTRKTILSFTQQVDEYRYMILNWTPSPRMSYMQYLSQIALGMILDIKQYIYYISNNLDPCSIYTKDYYKNNFNERTFRTYVFKNFN
jgi:hypothetical protein